MILSPAAINSLVVSEKSNHPCTSDNISTTLCKKNYKKRLIHLTTCGEPVIQLKIKPYNFCGLFIAHEHSAKKQGQLIYPCSQIPGKIIHIKHCMNVTSARTQALILRHQQANKGHRKKSELIETLGLVHYTYTNYDHAAFIFKTLCALSPDIQKLDEYQLIDLLQFKCSVQRSH